MCGRLQKSASLFLAVVLAVGLMPLPAYAQADSGGTSLLAAGSFGSSQAAELQTQADRTSVEYTILLDELNEEVTAAKAEVAAAQITVDQVTPDYNAAKQSYDEGAVEYEAAKRDADAAKAAYDKAIADLDAADEAAIAAENALIANQNAIPLAESALDEANAAATASKAAYDKVAATATEAEGQLATAQAAYDEAQAAVEADQIGGVPTTNKEAWTALGLFKHIRDNAEANSAQYWDAQCAIDILTGGTNTTGHNYGNLQEPTPDGVHASSWKAISDNVVLTDRGDAVALENFKASLDYIDEYNATRARHNQERGTNLSTNIGMNCRQMAVSIVQCDTSRDSNVGHTQAYFGLENLFWGTGVDPYSGWYDEERELYDNGERAYSEVGHYLTIIDATSSSAHAVLVGFAIATSNVPVYGECYELSLFMNPNSPSTYYPMPAVSYSPTEFKTQWFDDYYHEQVLDGMNGSTDEVKALHLQKLATATTALQTAQGRYDEAAAVANTAKQQWDADAAAAAAAEATLNDLTSQTTGLQADVETKEAAADQCAIDAQNALDVYNAAQQELDEQAQKPVYIILSTNLAKTKAAKDAADEALATATNKRNTAQTRLDTASNLSDVTLAGLIDMPYTGSSVLPNISVRKTFEGETYGLAADAHYRIEHGPNVNVGPVAVTISGLGFQGEGKTWGSVATSFNIVAPDKSDLSFYQGKAAAFGFSDLDYGEWYMGGGGTRGGYFPDSDTLYMDYAVGRGLMSGYNDGTGRFAPNDPMNRGMAATIIYRMATRATASTTNNDVATSFTDVHPGDWYAAAVKWCAEHDVTTGYTDGSGRFAPLDPVTREQLVTMIARYCENVLGMPASDKDVSRFLDSALIHDWALDGVAFCVSHDIVSGMGDTGNFGPRETALRCQMAKIIAVTARMLE